MNKIYKPKIVAKQSRESHDTIYGWIYILLRLPDKFSICIIIYLFANDKNVLHS